MRDSSRFPCHHRVWGPVLAWPRLVTRHCSQWSGYCSSDLRIGWWRLLIAVTSECGGAQAGVKARPGVSVSQGLLPLRLTNSTQTHWSHVICSSRACPCSWWTSQTSEQWTMQRRKSRFLCHTPLPSLSVVCWVRGGPGSWQSQPRRNHWQTWVDGLPGPWVNTSNENDISSTHNPRLPGLL